MSYPKLKNKDDAWGLCRQMKLVIKFFNGISDAKIQNPVRVTYIKIIYVGICDVNYKIVFGNYSVFFRLLGLRTQNPYDV